ncbi:MAG: bifunctional phosphoglucose/phosphomannose isomerase [Actinomycetota bacterium]
MVIPASDPLRRSAERDGSDLDDAAAFADLDSENVLGAVERFAEQCREAWAIGVAATSLPDATDVSSMVVLGMGGSGVSGDVVQSVVEPRLPVPLRTIKGYGPLPEWIGRNTLLFAVSYSGDTEETIAAFTEALDRGARAVAISSGGRLGELAAERGVAHVAIPSGLQPRASLGYLMLPVLAVLEKVELIPPLGEDVDEACAVVQALGRDCGRAVATADNPAKTVAAHLVGRIPFVYGAEGLAATAAYRFKCDLNEYGKVPAGWHRFPELNHNEIVGWDQLSELTQSCVAVMLRDVEEHPRIARRIEITKNLIEPHLAEVVQVRARGRSPLARILSLVFVTQLAAIYVGLANGVDPGPVETIQTLKRELAEGEGAP